MRCNTAAGDKKTRGIKNAMLRNTQCATWHKKKEMVCETRSAANINPSLSSAEGGVSQGAGRLGEGDATTQPYPRTLARLQQLISSYSSSTPFHMNHSAVSPHISRLQQLILSYSSSSTPFHMKRYYTTLQYSNSTDIPDTTVRKYPDR